MIRYKISIEISILLFALTLFFHARCRQATPEQKFKSYIEKALKLEEEKKYKEVLYELDSAINIDSGKSFVFVFRGKIKSLVGDNESAISDLYKAITINAKNTSAFFHKGIAFSNLGKEDSAIANFDYAIDTKLSGNIYFNRTYSKLDEWEDQVDIPLHVIRYYRAISLYEKERESEALTDFQYSLSKKYEQANCQLYIGIIYINQGKEKDGCFFLNQAKQSGSGQAMKFISQYCESDSVVGVHR